MSTTSTTPEKNSARNHHGGDGSDTAEALVSLAREHFSAEFPNPDRRGCPSSAVVRESVLGGRPPDGEWSRHLFACAECFNLYRAILVEREASQGVPAVSWRSRLASTFGGRPNVLRLSLVGAAAALFVISAGWLAWHTAGNTDKAVVRPGPAASTSPLARAEAPKPGPEGEAMAEIASKARHQRSPAAESVPIIRRVDLEDYVALRNLAAPDAGENAEIRLPQARLRLILRLPENSQAGLYSVSLVTGDGQSVAADRARSRDGKRLTINLDLRRLAGGKYGLNLSRPGEPPEQYRVSLAEPPRKR